MTQISLRAYIREIDSLIERELLDEAIAHCRHILQSYPKHIETYRLLGKSYLEAKRYGDAADIFQRVLSAIPDDFVSHIGMAIVREDEGNLDSAIWHMERAFETNPANPAIQQELRRLIGRRDGLEPSKVRLTRGALARMYAQGELYPQAIAELQSALHEDPDRPDLQILLADMFWQTDQKMEAADVSGQILDKLPYCQKAARIMAAVHQERGKTEEGTAYHRRLAQLDPYAAYVEYPMVDTVKVEADTIRLERLDWRPGQPLPASESAGPDWASSLGVEIESDEDAIDTSGPLPSWLDDIEPTSDSLEVDDGEDEPEPTASPFEAPELAAEEPVELAESAEPTEPEAAEPVDIPDWMSDAGWQESSGEAVEAPVSFSETELTALERGELPAEEAPSESTTDEDSGELEPATIPSWLQEKAPGPEGSAAESPEPEASESDAPELEAPVAPESETEAGGGAPDWLEDIAEPTEPRAEAEPSQAPDWLGEMAAEAEGVDADMELPSFDLAGEEEEAAAEAVDAGDQGEVPSWLDDSEPGATSTILTWLGDREDTEEAAESDAEPAEIPDWMQAAAEGAEETEPAPAADEAEGGPPAWLSGLAQAAAESEEAELDELADLRAQTEAVADDELAEPELEAEAEPGEIPDWLMAIKSDEAPEEALDEGEFEAELPESFPWEAADDEEDTVVAEPMLDMGDEEEEPPETVRAPSAPPTEPTGVPASDIPPSDEADAASWLESLSEETEEAWPSDAGTPTQPGEPESATSWLESLGQAEEEAPADQPSSMGDEPEWMRGLEDEDTGDEAIGDLASTWLEGLADTLAETPSEPEEAAAGPSGDMEDVPTWLLDYEASEQAEEEAEPPAQEAAGIPIEPPETEIPRPASSQEESERQKLLEELGLKEEALESEDMPAAAGADQESYDLGQLEGMDDDQIFQWLEGLAARDEEEAGEEPAPVAEAPAEVEPPRDMAEPEAEDEGADLGWLEQLADQRGISTDVQVTPAEPSEPAPPTAEPQMEAPPEAPAEPAPPPTPVPPPVEAREPEPPAAEGVPAAPEQEPAETAPPAAAAEREPVEEEPPATIVPEAPPASQVVTPPEPEAPPAEPPQMPEAPPEAAVPPKAEPEPEEVVPEPTPEVEAEARPEPEPIPEPEAELEPKPQPVPKAEAEPQREPEPVPEPEAEVEPKPQPVPKADVEPESEPEPVPEPEAEAQPEPQPVPEVEPEPPSPVTEEVPESAPPTSDDGLETARRALEAGDLEKATAEYGRLIKSRRSLESVVGDLESALDRDPESSALWQTLGDAYMKADRASDAVKAYDRGMKEAEVLISARQALASGDAQRAAAQYGILIKGKKNLDDVIQDLESSLAQEADQPMVWQILGDAYMKADRLDEAIEAYRKGMSSV
jgi:cytochrome c-type biogenesis protein CcmH/NrfG